MLTFKNLSNNVLLIVCIIISSVLVSGCLRYDDKDSTDIDGITAHHAFDIINNIFYNNGTTGIIFVTVTCGIHVGNGFFNSVGFLFSENIENNKSVITHFTVFSNLSWSSENYTVNAIAKDPDITNWTIDSDDAYNIAINNTEISDYLNSTGNRAEIGGFSLHGRNNNSSVWYILWRNMGYLGFGQSHIEIEIDASTGEVLYTGPT